MAVVRIPPVLRPDAGGNRDVEVEAATVREALTILVAEYPGLDGRVLAQGELPPYLNVFVDGDDVRLDAGLDTAVTPQSALLLLPAVAGGLPI
jgi:molybdopterin converting factor small subunit